MTRFHGHDHGMGVVIGETAIVGDECLIYQGVTLGGPSLSPGKRHPTLEPHVVVGSGAKVLGNITLGSHTRVGSGSVVIRSSPPHSTIVGIPGRIIEEKPAEEARPGHELEHNRLPNPTARAITALHEQLQALAREVAEVRQRPLDVVLPPGLAGADIEEAFRSIRAGDEDARATAFEEFREGGGISRAGLAPRPDRLPAAQSFACAPAGRAPTAAFEPRRPSRFWRRRGTV